VAQQLTFDLPVKPALGREDFFVSDANRLALNALEQWLDWPQGKIVLIGDAGSGKTHLSHVWAELAGATVVDAQELPDLDVAKIASHPVAVENADCAYGNALAETALFHLHNLVLANGNAILFTARTSPRDWALTLPDLKSRIEAAPTIALEAPDDALIAAVMLKLFTDRQIAISPNVLPYLVNRMPRSFAVVHELVATLDASSLTSGKPIGRKLAGQVLDKITQNGA